MHTPPPRPSPLRPRPARGGRGRGDSGGWHYFFLALGLAALLALVVLFALVAVFLAVVLVAMPFPPYFYWCYGAGGPGLLKLGLKRSRFPNCHCERSNLRTRLLRNDSLDTMQSPPLCLKAGLQATACHCQRQAGEGYYILRPSL